MSENKKWFDKLPVFQKLKNIKNIEVIIAVIFAIVIFLIYLSSLGKTSVFNDSTSTAFEQRLCAILSDIDGAGNVSVFVNSSDDSNNIIGIIVVSSGAQEVRVRLDILRAIQTVLNQPTTNIEILVGNK